MNSTHLAWNQPALCSIDILIYNTTLKKKSSHSDLILVTESDIYLLIVEGKLQ